MPESKNRLRTQPELAFFGTVTASLSHELRNVLATVDEYAGLMADFGEAAGPDGVVSAEKVRSISERIALQVLRGREISRRLNRFSHTVDRASETFELNEMVEETVHLVSRLAYLEQVRLSTQLSEQETQVTLDAFACGFVIFIAIQLALAAADKNRKVEVTVVAADGVPSIVVTSADPFVEASVPMDLMKPLETVAARIGAGLAWETDRLVLSFGN